MSQKKVYSDDFQAGDFLFHFYATNKLNTLFIHSKYTPVNIKQRL